MKIIGGFEKRDQESRSIFSHKGYAYELIPEYGNFPGEYEFTMYSNARMIILAVHND